MYIRHSVQFLSAWYVIYQNYMQGSSLNYKTNLKKAIYLIKQRSNIMFQNSVNILHINNPTGKEYPSLLFMHRIRKFLKLTCQTLSFTPRSSAIPLTWTNINLCASSKIFWSIPINPSINSSHLGSLYIRLCNGNWIFLEYLEITIKLGIMSCV